MAKHCASRILPGLIGHVVTRVSMCTLFNARGHAYATAYGQRRCDVCNEVVPYGPSDEGILAGPHAVQVSIEISAAFYALEADERPARWKRDHSTVVSMIGRGWWVHQMDLVEADDVTDHPSAQIGYLARQICTHEDDSRLRTDVEQARTK